MVASGRRRLRHSDLNEPPIVASSTETTWLRRLMELRAPDVIVRNEKRIIQEDVDGVFGQRPRGRVLRGNQQPSAQGPQRHAQNGQAGRFRQNLRGKPWTTRRLLRRRPGNSSLHQCGTAQEDGARALQAVNYHKARRPGPLQHHQASQGKWASSRKRCWDLRKTLSAKHPVMLNRSYDASPSRIQRSNRFSRSKASDHRLSAPRSSGLDGDQMP